MLKEPDCLDKSQYVELMKFLKESDLLPKEISPPLSSPEFRDDIEITNKNKISIDRLPITQKKIELIKSDYIITACIHEQKIPG